MTIGLIREGKTPPDKRVAFTPLQVEEIEQRFPHVKVLCETSEIRCFKDEEYKALDVEVVTKIQDCDILMGIKEVPIASLLEGKTYLFFSHTLKKQPYNRKLLQAALEKKIRLIDYEALKDKQGNRLVAFGRYAGIVGAYNGLWTYGKRYKKFSLRRAFECFDVNDLKLELRKVKLPSIKILLTGAGRVAKGAMETLDSARIRKVNIHDFLYRKFDEPVYLQLSSGDYHTRKEGGHFNREEFHQHPDRYYSHFVDFTKVTDILLAGAFWNPKAPVLFTGEDMLSKDFRIRIIASLHDADRKVNIPGFYDKVAELSAAERSAINKAPFDLNKYKRELGIDEVLGEKNYTTLERIGIRPTLDVNGIWGGYTGEGAKTVLPSKAYAKISMRLVPNQVSAEITELFTKHFLSIAPNSVKVKVTPLHGGEPAVTSTDSVSYKAASKAFEEVFGKTPIPMRDGGSIPIVALFKKELGLDTVLMGFGFDSDAIHSPNEHFGVKNFLLGIETIVTFYKHFSKT